MGAIYADYNATTPLDPRVFEVMREWYLGPPANAGSRTHVYGQRAREAVEKARIQVADVLEAEPQEIYFTSGATESNNLAILGLANYGERVERKHILSTAIEHKAVLEPLEQMRKRGFEVELVPVTPGGYVEPDEIRLRLRPDTLLVSVMHANNETGVLQPIQEISEIVASSEALFHTDTAQTFGKEVDELRCVRCDLISISAHKIYGPQGIGALYVRHRGAEHRPVEPIMFGGGQERGLRPGTLPVPLIVGFGKASEIALNESHTRRENALRVKKLLLSDLDDTDFRLNGDQERCQSHVLNMTFPGVDSEALLMAVRDELAISNGSACTSASYTPSHVLIAMGVDEDAANEAVRISWGPGIERIPVEPLANAARQLALSF